MSWSWAIQVLEGLSYHVKASGNQKVIFGPKDPWILVALKALGTLEDRQSKTEMIKKSQWLILILKFKTIRRLISQTHEKEDRKADWTVPGRLGDISLWLFHEKSCWRWCGRQGEIFDYSHNKDCVCPCCWEIVAVFSVFVSKQHRHAGSDGWSSNTCRQSLNPTVSLEMRACSTIIKLSGGQVSIRSRAPHCIAVGLVHIFTVHWGKNTTWPRGCQWKTFKHGVQVP